MKKSYVTTLFSVLMLSLSWTSMTYAASAKNILSHRLAMTKGFSADFSQKVVSPEGETIMQGKGHVDIARPSLFRWTTQSPDESVLVSDGKTLWYYTPFVEQVTIYDQQQATQRTPFVLLTRNRKSDWEHYKVTRKGNEFTLTPASQQAVQSQFKIQIDAKGVVQTFTVIEQDGQQGVFSFQHVKLGKPSLKQFKFTIPDGVEVDDQRNKSQ